MSTAAKESVMPAASKAVRNGAAATVAVVAPVTESVVAAFSRTSTAADAIVTGTTEVWTPLVRSAADRVREPSDGFAVQVKKIARRTVDVYQRAVNSRLDLSLVLADVVKVGWVSELTRRNATAVAELVAVSAGATHDLLMSFGRRRHQKGIASRSAPSRN